MMSTRRVVLSLQARGHLVWTSLAAGSLLLAAATASADIVLSNRVVTTPRHIFTVDDTGLPAQLDIRAVTNDIPLVWRTEKVWPAALLKSIGRGPQLAAPARIEAVIERVAFAAKADTPAELRKTDQGMEAIATWKAGELQGRLRLLYAEDGSLSGQVTFDAKGVALEKLDLVLEFSGAVDTAIAGNPVETIAGKPLSPDYGTLERKPGLLWLNGSSPAGDGSHAKGRVTHFFLGNGDRGFTWLAQGTEGFAISEKEPSISVERSRAGIVIWRIALVNMPAKDGERDIGFTLLTHPARLSRNESRLSQWQPWADKAAVPALAAAARSTLLGSNLLVRAEAGSVYETSATRVLLEGPAGGEALSANATLADRFPLGIFRYLAAPHTSLSAQLRPNAAAMTTAGVSPAPDRMALGRALLHDIGMDISGLAGRVSATSVLQALDEFGYFNDDGKTEFLPYWRTGGILQYGELFEGDIGFAVTAQNPTARTRVSAFVRPAGFDEINKKKVVRRKTLFVLVNEGTNAVSEYLLILNPTYLFGGPNKLQVEHIYSQLDFSDIAADGDWQRARVERSLPEQIKSTATMARGSGFKKSNGVISRGHMSELMDMETKGFVRLGEKAVNFNKAYFGDDVVPNGFQLYGPVYVPPRGMRLIYGAGRVDWPNGVAGRVVDRKTGKPLSVPVHFFDGSIKESEVIEPGKRGPYSRGYHKPTCMATIVADKDGKFRLSGFNAGTILAEVNGKMYPTKPHEGPRNDGMVVKEKPETDAEGNRYWPTTKADTHWSGGSTAGKWVDVLIEVD